jgi:hypothetical protein
MNMADLQVKGDDYQIVYDESNQAVSFQGTMRLRTWKDYAPMSELLRSAYETVGDNNLILTLDFRQLRFLNSSGIHALCKFVIEARKGDRSGMRVLGNPDFYWQHRSLVNLSKLWPKVQVDFG